MIKFSISKAEYENDIAELIRLFDSRVGEDFSLDVDYSADGDAFKIVITSDKFENFKKIYTYSILSKDALEKKRLQKRYLKMSVYRAVMFLTGIRLPYGCLTGIRPTKLYGEIQSDPSYGKSARDIFLHDYDVSEKKISLIERVVRVQKPLRNVDGGYDVFVFIPFCPTRCAYCSFVSLPIGKQRKLVEPYTECLIRELDITKKRIQDKNLPIRAVYIGGGTPTSIGVDNLERILEHCRFDGAQEFTVEAGRPDTIDRVMVDMLLRRGVTRISVNPQSFNDATLERIGRNHRARDIYNAFALVKGKMDVNMDLIAMLPGETFEDFKRSVDIAVALDPENITVHTLYMKKGSALKLSGYGGGDVEEAARMVDYAYDKLTQSGFDPYYMYRQKYTSGNLENVGYAKAGKECLYNIDIMEEDTSILANGANAISKKWCKQKNLITRCANYKEPLEYIKHIDEMLARQAAFWDD